jgi:hypothetical protein
MFGSFDSVLDECLAAIRNGEPVQACLERYPSHAERLRPLLEIADKIRGAPAVPPRLPAQTRAWQAMTLRANELRAGKRRLPTVSASGLSLWVRPIAAVFAIFLGLGALASGTALASQDAMPDSPLYRFKLVTEDVHLMLVFDEQSEAEILLEQSQERTREIRHMVARGKTVPASVLSSLENRNDRAASIIEDSPEAFELRDRLKGQALIQEDLLVAVQPDVSSSDQDDYHDAIVAVHNSYFVGADDPGQALLSEELSNGVISVAGVVSVLEDGTVMVGGVEVDIDARTIKGSQEIQPGASAEFTIAVSPHRRRVLQISNVRLPSENIPTKNTIVGEIEEIEEDRVRIDGEWIPLTDLTIKKGSIKVGQTVSAEVEETETGPVVNTLRTASNGQAVPLTYEGTIENNLDTNTVQLTIGGLDFEVTASTLLDLRAGDAVAGARARVHASVGENGVLDALSIAVLAADGAPDDVFIIGMAERVDISDWTVGGIDMDAPGGNPATVGDTIAVIAKLIDGFVVASSYQTVESEQTGDLTRLEGTITDIDETSWEGFGRQLRVDSKTRLSGKPIEGARAIVWGRNDPETGGFRAVYARIIDQRPVVALPDDDDNSGEGSEEDDD